MRLQNKFTFFLIFGFLWGILMFFLMGASYGYGFLNFSMWMLGGFIWGSSMYFITKKNRYESSSTPKASTLKRNHSFYQPTEEQLLASSMRKKYRTTVQEHFELFEEYNYLLDKEECKVIQHTLTKVKNNERISVECHENIRVFYDKTVSIPRKTLLKIMLEFLVYRVELLNDTEVKDYIKWSYHSYFLRFDKSYFDEFKRYLDEEILVSNNQLIVELEYASLKDVNEVISILEKELNNFSEMRHKDYFEATIVSIIVGKILRKSSKTQLYLKLSNAFSKLDPDLAFTLEMLHYDTLFDDEESKIMSYIEEISIDMDSYI